MHPRLSPAELRQLRETVQTTIQRLTEFTNDISPINLLPPETLTRISDFLCHTQHAGGTSDQAVTMTQVCRYWRSALTSYPWAWTDVAVKSAATPVYRVVTALENSRRLPLRLDIQIHLDEKKTPNYKDSARGIFRFAGFTPSPEPFAILSLLKPHHKRIQSLKIRFLYHGKAYSSAAARFIQHPFFRCSFDALGSLSLTLADACNGHYQPFVIPTPSARITGNFPILKSLTLSGVRHILHPGFQCPSLKTLYFDLPDHRGEIYERMEDEELQFLEQHSTLTAIAIKEQVARLPIEFCQLQSVTLSGGGFDISISNGVRPTFLTVMKSLTIQVSNELISIAAGDEDFGNSITCLVRHTNPLRIVEAWRAYLQFAQDGVEDLYLDLVKDIDSPYDVVRRLNNVKTVHITWTGMEKVVKKVVEAVASPPSQGRVEHKKLQVRRWVKRKESAQIAASRDKAFESCVKKVAWEYVLWCGLEVLNT